MYYPPETFLRTPITHIQWLLKQTRLHEANAANINSASAASLCNLVLHVAHGMSGAKGAAPKSNAKDFLPFPDLDKEFAQEFVDGPSPETKKILVALVKARQLPIHVFTALSTQVERQS